MIVFEICIYYLFLHFNIWPETPSPNETAVANESSAASLPVNHTVKSPSANGVALVKKDTGVAQAAPTPAPAVKVATTAAPVEKAAPTSSPAEEAAPASTAEEAAPTSSPAEKAAPAPPKDVTKRTYASIVSY